MDAVKNVLGVAGSVFHTAGGIFSAAGNVLSKMGTTIFVLGFIGILLTFLWFLFRYLDKKQLTLPTVVFVFFFFLFLGGNFLLITEDTKTDSPPETQAVGAQVQSADPLPEGEVRV